MQLLWRSPGGCETHVQREDQIHEICVRGMRQGGHGKGAPLQTFGYCLDEEKKMIGRQAFAALFSCLAVSIHPYFAVLKRNLFA